jgi:hypothetical protein
LIHPGILGCAPSAEVLATWNKREGELIAANKLDRIVAQPPEPKNVHAGSATEDIKEKVGKEGDCANPSWDFLLTWLTIATRSTNHTRKT